GFRSAKYARRRRRSPAYPTGEDHQRRRSAKAGDELPGPVPRHARHGVLRGRVETLTCHTHVKLITFAMSGCGQSILMTGATPKLLQTSSVPSPRWTFSHATN